MVHIGQRLLRPIPPTERLKECPNSHVHQTTSDETFDTMDEENPFRLESKNLIKFGLLEAKLLLDSLRFFGIFSTIFKCNYE